MPAKYSLSRTDFARMRGFRRLQGTLFSLSYGTLPDRATPGAACVVSAKTAARATTRNLIKRRARAALFPILTRLESPVVVVWHAKKPAISASQHEMGEEMTLLMQKAGVLPPTARS